MRKLLAALFLFALPAFAVSSEYSKDVHSAVEASNHYLAVVQKDPSRTEDFKSATVTLLLLDEYLVLNEFQKYKKHCSTKLEVDKKLAQLSRDMEMAQAVP